MINEKLFKQEQEKWISKISLKNNFELHNIKVVAGVDIAYFEKDNEDYGVCCIVLVDYETKNIIEKVQFLDKIEIPYIPGYLAFRELPLILEAAKRLKIDPDIYMFDGNGYMHYRHMGIATHASFYLNKPTIGVAKSYLKIEGRDFSMPENIVGDYTNIEINREIYGVALRTRENVKPVFVSCGNYIDLKTSIKITMDLIEKDSRLPVPTRYADLLTHESRKNYCLRKN